MRHYPINWVRLAMRLQWNLGGTTPSLAHALACANCWVQPSVPFKKLVLLPVGMAMMLTGHGATPDGPLPC